MLLQQIEDLYDDNWAKSKGIQWLMSFGRKQSILTNLKFALPIIVKLFEQIHQDNQNLKSNLDSTIFDLQWTQALYNQGYKEATQDLEIQVERLYETLKEHKLKDEINLLKSRALRSQVIELQQFISNISSNIHENFKDQALFLSTRSVPSFDQVISWTQQNIPYFPKIPITKYTMCEETNYQLPPLWEELTELHLTADDLHIPPNPDYFSPKEMRIIKFYENQIIAMQNSKLIPPLSEIQASTTPPNSDFPITSPQSTSTNPLNSKLDDLLLTVTLDPKNPAPERENSHQNSTKLSPLYLAQNSAGDSNPGTTSLPLYAHMQLNHQRNILFESSNFFSTHSNHNSDLFQIKQLQYEQPTSELETTQPPHPSISASTPTENDTIDKNPLLPAMHQDAVMSAENQQPSSCPNNQIHTQLPHQSHIPVQSVPLTDLNPDVTKLNICTFHSTHIPPFTCVQYIGILMQKLATSEFINDSIRKKNWELLKTLKIRLHIIKQLYLKQAFHKIRESGKDQRLLSATNNETFLREHIQWLKHRIHQLSRDYAKKFIAQKSELEISQKEIARLQSLIPQKPYIHWLASSQEFLDWHTENFTFITDTPSAPTSTIPTQPYLMWINEHPDFHQWLTETFEFTDDLKILKQARRNQYQSCRNIILQLKTNQLQKTLFFNKWKLKTVLLRNLRSLLKNMPTTPQNLHLQRTAILKWKLYIELQNTSALKSVIQISDEQHQQLTQENNQLMNQLWDTRRIHNLVQMELSSQLKENRSLLQENSHLRTELLQRHFIPQPYPQLSYKRIIHSNLQASENLTTIDIQLHDQLVKDLKEDYEESIAKLQLSQESLQEKYEIKFLEHQQNLQQYQKLKEDYSSLYKLILAFGQCPQTITLPTTYKPEALSTHIPDQHLQTLQTLPTNSSYPSPISSTFTRPSTQRQKDSHPFTPTEYKRKIRNFPSDSLLSLKCDSPEKNALSPIKKPTPTSSTTLNQTQSTHFIQMQSAKQPSHLTLNIGDPKQIMAINILKTSIPLDHPTIFESPTRTATITSAQTCEATQELKRTFGVNLISELSRVQKESKKTSDRSY